MNKTLAVGEVAILVRKNSKAKAGKATTRPYYFIATRGAEGGKKDVVWGTGFFSTPEAAEKAGRKVFAAC